MQKCQYLIDSKEIAFGGICFGFRYNSMEKKLQMARERVGTCMWIEFTE